jgi:glycosyltransferase involved in cell wall biosynthesis
MVTFPRSKNRHSSSKLPTVSVVLNVYKRGSNFDRQISAIRRQSHPVGEILVWENGTDKISEAYSESVTKARADSNLGVWARFAFGLNAANEFLWVLDDDTIPGDRWLENALGTFATSPGVIGSRGLRFRSSSSYTLYDEFGPNSPHQGIEEVDIVGHNWIFPTNWLGFFWAEFANKFDEHLAGEDMHLSYAVQKHLGFGTFVPPHPVNQPELWGELAGSSEFSGTDNSAISQSPASMKRFERAFGHYVDLGYRPMCSRDGQSAPIATELLARGVSRFPYASQAAAKILGIRKK